MKHVLHALSHFYSLCMSHTNVLFLHVLCGSMCLCDGMLLCYALSSMHTWILSHSPILYLSLSFLVARHSASPTPNACYTANVEKCKNNICLKSTNVRYDKACGKQRLFYSACLSNVTHNMSHHWWEHERVTTVVINDNSTLNSIHSHDWSFDK